MGKFNFVLCTAAAIALWGPAAQAADAVQPAAPAAEAEGYDWSGLYVGAAIGAGAIVHQIDVPALGGLSFNGIGGEGLFVELNGGYDIMVSSRVLVGAFADVWTGNVQTSADVAGTDVFAVTPEYGFDIGARLGYLVTPKTLAYVLGGYSWAHFNVEFLNSSVYDWDRGGFTVGAGMETALTDRVTLRGEYRYTQYAGWDFANLGAPPGTVDLIPSTHTFRVGVNYQFNRKGSAAAFATPAYDWNGFYISGAAGASGLSHQVNIDPLQAHFNGIGAEGIFGDLGIGYDREVGTRYVVGVQASARYGNVATTLDLPGLGGSAAIDADYGFDIVARAGFKPSEGTLAYVLGGWSYQHFDINATGVGSIYDWDANGFVVGGGVEAALTDRVTAGIEYRFAQYNDEDLIAPFLSVTPSSHTGKVTLKYKFN